MLLFQCVCIIIIQSWIINECQIRDTYIVVEGVSNVGGRNLRVKTIEPDRFYSSSTYVLQPPHAAKESQRMFSMKLRPHLLISLLMKKRCRYNQRKKMMCTQIGPDQAVKINAVLIYSLCHVINECPCILERCTY